MENSSVPQSTTAAAQPAMVQEVDPLKLQYLMEQLKSEQNFLLGLIGGCFAGLVGAIIWAVITYVTDWQIGWMAILNGFLVGYTVRSLGKGFSKGYGITGGAIALLSILLGNMLTVIFIIAREESVSLIDSALFFATNPGVMVEIIIKSTSFIDFLFYAVALYNGYKFSLRRLSRQEIQTTMRQRPAI